MKRALMVATALVGMLGCDVQPCDRYVNYVCDCHADDPEYDCEALSASLSNAGQAVQDQCAIDLDDLQDADAEAGLECSVEEI